MVTWLKNFKPNDSTKKLSQKILSQVVGNRPKTPRGTRGIGGIFEGQKHCYLRCKCIFGDLPLVSTQILRQMSFDNETLTLGYLNKRSQCVSINGKVSKSLLIDCGVPQGSILGPLLFIIYVNDFPNSCKIIFPFLFADDANCIYARPKNETSTLQDGVEHIPGWMAMNKLSQNIPKTELVHFLNCKDESIVMKNTEITCTEYVKYLGISLIVVINLLNRRDADY